jgi:hypothetical protein
MSVRWLSSGRIELTESEFADKLKCDEATRKRSKKGFIRARRAVQANINAAPGTAAGEGGPPR